MSAHNLTRDYQNPVVPRLDDEDEHEEAAVTNTPASVGALIQKKFLEQRKIFLWGAVTDETAKDLTEKLLYLEATAPGKDITFYMNTPGGSITAGMAVYDTIKLITSPVTSWSPAWRPRWVPSSCPRPRRAAATSSRTPAC